MSDATGEANKRQKTMDFDTDVETEVSRQNLGGFELKQILAEKGRIKSMYLHGRFGDQEAVVLLEKTAFQKESVAEIMTSSTTLKQEFQNDVYSVSEAFPPSNINGVKTTIICPATEKHVAKYTAQRLCVVEETYEDYESITLPYLKEHPFGIQWVYNILEKKAETEHVIFEDPDPMTGFVLLPDMKWDKKNIEELYLVVIVHRHGIKSLRDLTTEHLPLLENIRDKCLEQIESRYGLTKERLRAYIHYQPSYYHLHVHITNIQHEAPGIQVEKSHLLSDVIENIQMMPNYYQRKTLTFALKERDGLLAAFRNARNGSS